MSGGDLSTLLAGGGGLEPGHALALVGQLAAALGPEHERGFAHGAIEPANVEVEGDRARLTGFGARPYAAAFSAPEVLGGGEPTPRSDVYSLAALLCFALTGGAPSSAARVGGALPGGVRTVLEGALARDPADRPADAAALMALVRAAVAGRGGEPTPRRFFRRRRRRRLR
jgi:serine/threonine protein kinase